MLVVVLAVFLCLVCGQAPKDSKGLKPKLQKLVERLNEIKAPAPVPHQALKHEKLQKPTDADKNVAADVRFAKLIEYLKLYQGQQMVLGSALHTIMEKLNQENEQIEDQNAVLTNGFKALLENVATRTDMEEIQTAAGEDNELHMELEDSTKKLQELLKHMSDVQGNPEDDFSIHFENLRKAISTSSIDGDLKHLQEIVKALTGHTEAATSSLWFFILLNLVLLLGLLLWRTKGSYQFPR